MSQTTKKPDLPKKRGDTGFWKPGYLGFDGIVEGLILIFLGSVLFLDTQGNLEFPWWQYFIPGLGIILLAEGLLRYRQEKNPGFLMGRLIVSGALITWGITFALGVTQFWPLFIIAAGAVVLLLRLVKR